MMAVFISGHVCERRCSAVALLSFSALLFLTLIQHFISHLCGIMGSVSQGADVTPSDAAEHNLVSSFRL